MGNRLKEKVAIVVGAGQQPGDTIGNGRAISILFAREDAKVMLVDCNLDSAQETEAMINREGGESFAFKTDIVREDDCRQMVEKCVEVYGRIDILVNNVGVGEGDRNIVKISEEVWDRIFNTNLKGNPIKLGIRYNGQQHEDSPEGWKAFKGIARNPNVQPGSNKYQELWSKWRRLIETDKLKVKVFKDNEQNGYYIIEVDYRISPSQMQQFIIDEFERQTDIQLEKKDSIDWRRLL